MVGSSARVVPAAVRSKPTPLGTALVLTGRSTSTFNFQITVPLPVPNIDSGNRSVLGALPPTPNVFPTLNSSRLRSNSRIYRGSGRSVYTGRSQDPPDV